MITEETRAKASEIIARYPQPRSALLPLLHLVQSADGYVSPEGVAMCAELLGITEADVRSVATFYTMFKREPVGKHLVGVCTNISCMLRGSEELFAEIEQYLGIGHEETTADGAITLEKVECAAACDYAPVMTVNYEFFDQMTPEKAKELLDGLRAGNPPLPTRGAPLTDFRTSALMQAGFADERPGAVDATGSGGESTLRGVALAAQRGQSAPDMPKGN